jgi:hypothetical protein
MSIFISSPIMTIMTRPVRKHAFFFRSPSHAYGSRINCPDQSHSAWRIGDIANIRNGEWTKRSECSKAFVAVFIYSHDLHAEIYTYTADSYPALAGSLPADELRSGSSHATMLAPCPCARFPHARYSMYVPQSRVSRKCRLSAAPDLDSSRGAFRVPMGRVLIEKQL